METLSVLITGATSGIGKACAEVFAENNWNLILWARRSERLAELKEHLQSKTKVIIQTVDVRDRHAVITALNETHFVADDNLPPGTRHPVQHIDVLINNAGLSRSLNPVQEGEYEDWDEMIDTNIKGLLNVTREIVPSMVERGTGTIINIASIAGRQAYRGGNVYGATKAAVKLLSESFQIDLNGTGVRVCNIDPGLVETEFSLVRYRGDTERAAKTYKGLTPLIGKDIADIVYFVATRPPHVSIQDVMVTPTDQANVYVVARD